MGDFKDQRVTRLEFAYSSMRKPPRRSDFQERARMFGMSDAEFDEFARNKKWSDFP